MNHEAESAKGVKYVEDLFIYIPYKIYRNIRILMCDPKLNIMRDMRTHISSTCLIFLNLNLDIQTTNFGLYLEVKDTIISHE